MSNLPRRPPPPPETPPRLLPARRTCLGCRKPFDSDWCGNRLCEQCRSRANRRDIGEAAPQ